MPQPFRVTFVCTGNICRSPMAEIILRDLLSKAGLSEQVVVDSAGCGGEPDGSPIDSRARAVLTANGYAVEQHRARRFLAHWFADTDLVLCADEGHVRRLRRMAPDAEADARIRLIRSFDPDAVANGDLDIDDPWYGGPEDFDRTYTEVLSACEGLIEALPGLMSR